MPIDIYDTRTMLKALVQMKRPRTFLRDTFFGGLQTFTTKHVDLDIVKGSRKIAAFVSPLSEGKVVADEGYDTQTFTPPYLKEKKSLTPQELFTREAGSTIYAPGDGPAQRAQKELGKKLSKLDDRFTRREEVMCAQAMDTGTVTCVGEGINAVVDFGMPAAHKITLGGIDLWTDQANSNPGDDLVDWCQMIAKASGVVPNRAIMGLDVWKAFKNHPAIKDKLDNRRILMGQINPQNLPNGVTYLGSFTDAGVDLDLYAYSEWFVDPADGLEKPIVPADKLWLGSTNARCEKLYGAIQDIDAGGLAALQRYPKSWVVKDPSVRWVLLQSAPLMGLLQPDAFASIKPV